MKPAPDIALDAACAELRRRIRKRGHGRVFLEVDVDGGVATEFVFRDEAMTKADWERLVTGVPRPRERG